MKKVVLIFSMVGLVIVLSAASELKKSEIRYKQQEPDYCDSIDAVGRYYKKQLDTLVVMDSAIKKNLYEKSCFANNSKRHYR
jgi:hypothetical protein